jgi:hypothetical protein
MDDPRTSRVEVKWKEHSDPGINVRGGLLQDKTVVTSSPVGQDFGETTLKRRKGSPRRTAMEAKAKPTKLSESMKLELESHGKRRPAFVVMTARTRLWRDCPQQGSAERG